MTDAARLLPWLVSLAPLAVGLGVVVVVWLAATSQGEDD